MVRNVLGILTGLVVGFIVTAGIQMMNYRLAPLPAGLSPTDVEGMKAYMANLPTVAFVIVLISHIMGTASACFMACKIADNRFTLLALILGGFFLVMGIINLLSIPHPIWFSAVDCLVYIPAALFGKWLATR